MRDNQVPPEDDSRIPRHSSHFGHQRQRRQIIAQLHWHSLLRQAGQLDCSSASSCIVMKAFPTACFGL
jgi:hypothetical protein